MHLFNQLITDYLLYIPVKNNKVLYQKSISNFLTFNILSILFIDNIIDIINILYKRVFNSVALHIRGKGAYGVCMSYIFFLHKENVLFSIISIIYYL